MSYSHDDIHRLNNAQRKDNTFHTRGADKTRPSGTPAAKKDFKKVLQNENSDENEDNSANEVGGQDEAGEIADSGSIKKDAFSLFDLSGAKTTRKGGGNPSPFAAKSPPKLGAPLTSASHEQGDIEGALETGNVFAKDIEEEETLDKDDQTITDAHSSDAYARLTGKKGFSKETFEGDSGASSNKEKFTTRFSTEQTDLSYVNPLATADRTSFNIETAKNEKTMLQASHIQDIINQLVEKTTQMELDGKTETTITLKQPPILAGANLIVSEFDSAKGEFNISFENLSQAAKNIIDMRANQDSLRLALEAKGYAVHIVTATTEVERPVIDTPQPSGSQSDERRQQRESGGSLGQRPGQNKGET